MSRRRHAASGTMAVLLVSGLIAPASQAQQEDPVVHGPAATATDVVVLELSDDDGAPTELAQAADGDADAAVASVLTAEHEVAEFYVAAVTWDGLESPDEQISIRVRTSGEWTGWTTLEPDMAQTGDVGGTEPYIVGGADAVQLRMDGGDSALPTNLGLSLIPPEPGEQEARAATERAVDELAAAATTKGAPADAESGEPASAVATPAVSTADVRPGIVSRAGWGANESQMTWTPRLHTLRAAVVHHTAGHNNYTAAQSAGIVRGIYHYHAVSRGWGDIGYNFVVDKYGQMFEGRSGSLASPPGQMPQGAHASGFNSGTLGISVLGNYETVRAPQQVLDTMGDIIAWQFAEAGLRAADASGFTSPGTAARPAGQPLARIFAHRDVGATACPGDNIYARIPALIARVDDQLDGPAGDADDVSEHHLRNSLTPGPADLVLRLGLPSDDVLVGDWDGDGVDTIAVRRGEEFHLYNSLRGGGAREVVHYGRADDVVLVGDWDGDGADTLAVRRGKEYHVKNSISSGGADTVIDYGRDGDVVLVGDWDADGRDTFAVRRGAEYHLRNVMAGGDADVVLTYGRDDDVVLVGDWDADGRDTFAVRRDAEYHVRNAMAGGEADVVFHYGRPDDVVLVGDWDADGRDTLGVRRN